MPQLLGRPPASLPTLGPSVALNSQEEAVLGPLTYVDCIGTASSFLRETLSTHKAPLTPFLTQGAGHNGTSRCEQCHLDNGRGELGLEPRPEISHGTHLCLHPSSWRFLPPSSLWTAGGHRMVQGLSIATHPGLGGV